jgi:hypothetical protein
VSDEDSHDAWRALDGPARIADAFVEMADRAICLLRRILAKLEGEAD